ncbi:hypothetical protein ACF3MZ_29685 [Paenibacillaceae bacterium WGS1546]|uniref:hypothetical protein n=1 Tax=Cohnella sp. WGS1546 TaxID=3366810 RepID=UPI00372D7AA2
MSKKKRDKMKAKAARHGKPLGRPSVSQNQPVVNWKADGRVKDGETGGSPQGQSGHSLSSPEWRQFYSEVSRFVR